jgi:hypothetical protein
MENRDVLERSVESENVPKPESVARMENQKMCRSGESSPKRSRESKSVSKLFGESESVSKFCKEPKNVAESMVCQCSESVLEYAKTDDTHFMGLTVVEWDVRSGCGQCGSAWVVS